MKFNWFIRKGILFFPYSIMGWLIFITAAAYAVYLFIDIDSRSHSVSDTLINWVFNCLILAVAYSIVGYRKKEGPGLIWFQVSGFKYQISST